jgi:hypothetical protein
MSATQPPTPVPAAWYPNPDGSGQRYWDGSVWTDHFHDAEQRPLIQQINPDQDQRDTSEPRSNVWEQFTAFCTRGRGWTTRTMAGAALVSCVLIGMAIMVMSTLATGGSPKSTSYQAGYEAGSQDFAFVEEQSRNGGPPAKDIEPLCNVAVSQALFRGFEWSGGFIGSEDFDEGQFSQGCEDGYHDVVQ